MIKHQTEKSSVRGDSGWRVEGHGKILQSLPTDETVEQRARELAVIAGRHPNRPTASDRLQARKELLGDDSSKAAADEQNIVPSGMGAPPTSTGTRTKRQRPDDDETEIQTVQEGVDEATHDQMLKASKSQTPNQG